MSKFTKTLITDIIEWYNEEFKMTSLYKNMETVTEGSQWHHERSVAAHTDMVFMNGLRLVMENENHISSSGIVYALFACAFHDVGKPAAMKVKYKKERGDYLSFGGHELISARLWEDFAVSNYAYLNKRFGITTTDMFCIGWIIQNHLWHSTKVSTLVDTYNEMMIQTSFDIMLQADQIGRMSTNYEDNVNQTLSYLHSLKELSKNHERTEVLESAPTMFLPIAISGSGKSTFSSNLEPHVEVYSWDQLRLDWYGEPYEKAFQSSTKDKKFNTKAQKVLFDILKQGKDVYVDNMNHTRKARRWLISAARSNGYRVEAILFPISIDTVVTRQTTRSDKTLPEYLVRDMYMKLSLPNLGHEVDDINIVNSNLPS